MPFICRGARVVAPFGKRRLLGIISRVGISSDLPESRLLPLASVLDEGEAVLPAEMMDLLEWCSDYYKHAAGEVVFNALPPALRRAAGKLPGPECQYRLSVTGFERLAEGPGRAPRQHELLEQLKDGPKGAQVLRDWNSAWRQFMARAVEQSWVVEEPRYPAEMKPEPGPGLNDEQSQASSLISASLGSFRCHLLDGVTGSGKTEIYLELIRKVLGSGRQALVLVPEIGLTPQLIRRVRERLGMEPVVYHSGLSDGQRLKAWSEARSGQARLMLGTRSALFMPLPEAGLIIMDESHDASFRQQDGFRFSARDVAVKRASVLKVPIVLGTATPSLETLHNAWRDRYTWNRLRKRATGAEPPSWRVLDLRQKSIRGGLLGQTLETIGQTLEQGEQVLIFLNRRGYAPVLLCHDCGWHATCLRCDANLTWHRSAGSLICHHCDHRQSVPPRCPECAADALQGAGAGTQQLEQFLARQFSDYPLYRFDRDQTGRKGAFEDLYEKVRSGQPCILVGTQMLAKGHHFPMVTRVVIVNLDQALYSGDYRAMERLGQLMVQVAGRAGREQRPGEVLLQTHHPDHPLLELLLKSGYEAFARELLRERSMAMLPPFSFQAALRAEATEKEPIIGFLQAAQDCFGDGGVKIHGPYPALMERKGGRLRWYLLLQASSRPVLQRALDEWLPAVRKSRLARRVRWVIDVDPQQF